MVRRTLADWWFAASPPSVWCMCEYIIIAHFQSLATAMVVLVQIVCDLVDSVLFQYPAHPLRIEWTIT